MNKQVANTVLFSLCSPGNMTSTPCSPFLFRVIGEQTLGREVRGNSRSYVAFFGVRPLKVHQLWLLIVDGNGERSTKNFAPKHLMWALLLLRSYSREEILATLAGVSEKTFRKWAWMMVEEIAKIESLVSIANRRISYASIVTSTPCCY